MSQKKKWIVNNEGLKISVKEFGSRSNTTLLACADPENFVRGSQTFTRFFFSLMRGERIQIPL